MLKFVNEAEKQCNKSPGPHRHGCVISQGGKLISKGFNYHEDPYCFKRKRCKSLLHI